MIYSFSESQINDLSEYFAHSEVRQIGIDSETGKMIISFISHFDKNQELRSNIIPREPE